MRFTVKRSQSADRTPVSISISKVRFRPNGLSVVLDSFLIILGTAFAQRVGQAFAGVDAGLSQGRYYHGGLPADAVEWRKAGAIRQAGRLFP